MIEIVPNWHPVFVHFPLALLSVSVVFFLLAAIAKQHRLHDQWLAVAHWNLWLGAAFAVVTAITGWFAYNSVAHDTASHIAMTDHRNWAIAALAIFLALALWSGWIFYRRRPVGTLFLILAVVGFGVLLSTGWRGGELVFRHGLGVMSLPDPVREGHEHDGADETGRVMPNGRKAEQPNDSARGDTHVHEDGKVHNH